MKSHAAVASHPLHAMLIPFPFAFLVGAVFFDAIGLLGGLPTFWLVGHYMLAAGHHHGAGGGDSRDHRLRDHGAAAQLREEARGDARPDQFVRGRAVRHRLVQPHGERSPI